MANRAGVDQRVAVLGDADGDGLGGVPGRGSELEIQRGHVVVVSVDESDVRVRADGDGDRHVAADRDAVQHDGVRAAGPLGDVQRFGRRREARIVVVVDGDRDVVRGDVVRAVVGACDRVHDRVDVLRRVAILLRRRYPHPLEHVPVARVELHVQRGEDHADVEVDDDKFRRVGRRDGDRHLAVGVVGVDRLGGQLDEVAPLLSALADRERRARRVLRPGLADAQDHAARAQVLDGDLDGIGGDGLRAVVGAADRVLDGRVVVVRVVVGLRADPHRLGRVPIVDGERQTRLVRTDLVGRVTIPDRDRHRSRRLRVEHHRVGQRRPLVELERVGGCDRHAAGVGVGDGHLDPRERSCPERSSRR